MAVTTLYCQECGGEFEVPPMLGYLTDGIVLRCGCGAGYRMLEGQHPDDFLAWLLFPPELAAA